MLKEIEDISPLESKLKELVPPAVRVMVQELNIVLQDIVNQQVS
jgi:hypothetical protein